MSLVFFLLLVTLFQIELLHSFEGEEGSQPHRQACRRIFHCKNFGEIKFPFTHSNHPECGLFLVDGCEGNFQRIQLERGGKWYQLNTISQGDTITIHDPVLAKQLEPNECKSLKNISYLHLPILPYVSFEILSIHVLHRCNSNSNSVLNSSFLKEFSHQECKNYTIYYDQQPSKPPEIRDCPIIQLPFIGIPPIKRLPNNHLFQLLTPNISVEVRVASSCLECYRKGGQCLINKKQNFQCGRGHNKLTLKLGLAITLGLGASMISVAFYFICFRMKCSSMVFGGKNPVDHQKIEAFLKGYESLAPKRYTYLEIKKMSNSFRDKLGQGGYGAVYKGKLLDGRLVAVKVLNKLKGNGEEFINEVASISSTSHVNIVTLLGFCFENYKKALVYEFVPNGSLDKFIYQNYPMEQYRRLEWETLYKIAIGIARGLEYLHRGCNTRILHFDIKPHNILLDENFCPKISDFGLAKLCPRKDSIISMTGARGTAGYIAPEVFCRAFGGVSHKSDVYNFGMMVLEMVGGRRNIHVEVDRSSEIYFPQWIYERLELDEEYTLWGIANEADKERATKMILVSLWCVQTDPSNRPQMSRVLEMLEGNLDSLKLPAKPFLSSPST